VVRADTGAVVADVLDLETCRDRAIVELPGEPVSAFSLVAIGGEPAIAGGLKGASPQPTIVCFLDAAPEANF